LPRIVGILRADMADGLALTGVDVMPVDDAADFKQTLLEIVDSREYAVAVVDESLLAGLDERTAAALASRVLPLIVPIPGELRWVEEQAMPKDDYIALLIRRAVGYQLNIKV
jgi:vacuolar-type H+-ATPase subunit F/Vma7